ncbi:DNA-binding E3 ubiquitin-protein ligase SNT2 [Aspergillus lucknowensis]|uniref:PHD finger and BAH domain protein n=1 Tax=Aspergillus lucknowensis TaxID=176173 RepID=A0ABR4LH74_9EURO
MLAMASDRSPPQKSQQHHVRPDSSSTNTPVAGNHCMPTPGQSSRRGSADSSTLQESTNVNASQSQPMTASASPSEATATEPPSTSATPAPYGTRSRGRNAPRPNYAEDRDIDVDLELQQPYAKSSKRSGAIISNSTNGSKTGEPNSRKSLTATSGYNSPAAKDGIPGTSSFLAKPDEANSSSSSSRKRKQPASSTTPTSANENTSKKLFTAAPGAAQGLGDSNMVTFHDRGAYLKNGKITADDGTTFAVNEHVYLICEPPGEPYYLARIMEFIPNKNSPSGPIEALRVNWYYRPRDIQRNAADTRLVFASMHSDTCPLTSLRGKCQITHSSEIKDFEEYRKTRDCFWYDKMFDRYIHRYYEVIPTNKVINVPANVKKVLDEQWRYVLVEVGKRKELTSAVKTCKRCGLYAANTNSVDCAVCHNTYHMHCVRPVLTKKPARGFAWACAACSRAQERKLEARNTPMLGDAPSDAPEADEEMIEEEEDEDQNGALNGTTGSTPTPIEEAAVRPATEEQIAQAKLWPYRYLGIHCRVEDVLDYDDRIYPRASSRLGPRHQAIVNPWPGRPIEYVKPIDIKKKYLKGSGGRRDSRLSKETLAAMEAAKKERANRPDWVMEEPQGFIRRGEDEPVPVAGKSARTAELLFKMPPTEQIPARGEGDESGAMLNPADREKFIDEYMERAKQIAPDLGVEKYSTNFLDKALELLYAQNFNAEAALARLKQLDKHKDLKEPHLRPEEVKYFEQGVAQYGSELRNVTKHVGTVPHYQIVRYYYMWKKTPRGRQIWGGYEGRKGKKEAKRSSTSKLVDDVADDHDDSAFDNDKATEKKRGFQCKFCSVRSSRQWRRAPGVSPGATVPSEPSSRQRDKGAQLTVALCLRCALLWRKYGIQWESVDEVAKKIGQSGNKSWRRRIDEELLTQLLASAEGTTDLNSSTAAAAASIGLPIGASSQVQQDPRKKGRNEKESTATSTATSVEPVARRKLATDKTSEPPPIEPEPPVAKTLPCAICAKIEPMGDQYVSCRDCRLTVHRNCYGISPLRNCLKWLCDTCSNDRSPSISTTYECVLCPVTWTEHELMEAPKPTHKRKTERDREKEKLERGLVADAIKLYRERQEAVGKPIGPREPLKRTAGNNWIHVNCALWMPEIKFGNAEELEPAEGFGLIPADRFRETCKICKSNKGACVSCHFSGCNSHFHIGCAFQASYQVGFDVTPIKSSRRDTVPSVRLGEEVGVATPAIWCPHHSVSSIIHEPGQPAEDGLNASQLYARTYKQADLNVTGTVRRAAYNQQSAGLGSSGNRRVSNVNGTTTLPVITKEKPAASEETADEMGIDSDSRSSHQSSGADVTRKCATCSTMYSPRWWPIDNSRRTATAGPTTPSLNGVGSSASPPYHYQHRQPSLPALNGDHGSPDRTTGQAESTKDSRVLHDCHKCHLKKSKAQSSPEPRLSPYSAQRAVLPTPRLPDYHGHTYGSSHSHSNQQSGLPRAVRPPVVNSPERYPGYQKPEEYGENKLRSGLPNTGYRGGPPPPASIRQMNGYQAPAPHPSQPHYPSGSHPPQPYSAHQSPYGRISMSPSHPPTAPGPRAYAPSASPPDVPATMVRHSPQHSLSALNGGAPSRMYSVERVLSAPTQSPPVSQAHMDPRGRTPPIKLDENTVAGASMPLSGGRHGTTNGTSSGSGASASPSLKNLLS